MNILRLADPPREIPPGLRLKLLTPYDVTGTMMFTIPAAVLLLTALGPWETKAPRIALVVIGSLLLLLAIPSALPAFVRAMTTLRRMRYGILTVGRIVSCRLPWDNKRSEMPYKEFLENWTVKVARSQMGKGMGCLTTIFLWIIVGPLVLFIIGATMAAVMAWFDPPDAAAIAAGQFTFDHAVLVMLAGTVTVICIYLFTRLFRWFAVAQVEPYMQWRKVTNPDPDAAYNEYVLLEILVHKLRAKKVSLKEPLPEDSSSAVPLVCKVEYSVLNTPQVATGRARLCDRLDTSGVELLLFEPARPGEVELLAGLPAEVQVDPLGQWKDVPNGALPAITGTVAAIALIALAANIQLLRA